MRSSGSPTPYSAYSWPSYGAGKSGQSKSTAGSRRPAASPGMAQPTADPYSASTSYQSSRSGASQNQPAQSQPQKPAVAMPAYQQQGSGYTAYQQPSAGWRKKPQPSSPSPPKHIMIGGVPTNETPYAYWPAGWNGDQVRPDPNDPKTIQQQWLDKVSPAQRPQLEQLFAEKNAAAGPGMAQPVQDPYSYSTTSQPQPAYQPQPTFPQQAVFQPLYGSPMGGFSPQPTTPQRDAFINNLNEQMIPYYTGQASGPPQFDFQQAWDQGGQMVQNGWQNPFAQMLGTLQTQSAPPVLPAMTQMMAPQTGLAPQAGQTPQGGNPYGQWVDQVRPRRVPQGGVYSDEEIQLLMRRGDPERGILPMPGVGLMAPGTPKEYVEQRYQEIKNSWMQANNITPQSQGMGQPMTGWGMGFPQPAPPSPPPKPGSYEDYLQQYESGRFTGPMAGIAAQAKKVNGRPWDEEFFQSLKTRYDPEFTSLAELDHTLFKNTSPIVDKKKFFDTVSQDPQFKEWKAAGAPGYKDAAAALGVDIKDLYRSTTLSHAHMQVSALAAKTWAGSALTEGAPASPQSHGQATPVQDPYATSTPYPSAQTPAAPDVAASPTSAFDEAAFDRRREEILRRLKDRIRNAATEAESAQLQSGLDAFKARRDYDLAQAIYRANRTPENKERVEQEKAAYEERLQLLRRRQVFLKKYAEGPRMVTGQVMLKDKWGRKVGLAPKQFKELGGQLFEPGLAAWQKAKGYTLDSQGRPRPPVKKTK